MRLLSTSPIVVLTGAGISRESGLHTFRDADGIWAQVRLEDVATPEGYARDPARVQGFYNARRRGLNDPGVVPNAAHFALANLERLWPADVLVVTQNIDDLHERAGQQRLIHMHGELLKAFCTQCRVVERCTGELSVTDSCPNSAHTVELNLEPSQGATLFAESVLGPATEVVPAFVNELLTLL